LSVTVAYVVYMLGRTALHCAVDSHGRATSTGFRIDATHTIRLLIDSGANLNQPVNRPAFWYIARSLAPNIS